MTPPADSKLGTEEDKQELLAKSSQVVPVCVRVCVCVLLSKSFVEVKAMVTNTRLFDCSMGCSSMETQL